MATTFSLLPVCFIFAADRPPEQPAQKRRKFGSKVSPVTMSEIDMMRRLVQHVDDPPPSWKRKSACSWKGVSCNRESQVTQLWWNAIGLSGNVTWNFLPPHVTLVMAPCHQKKAGLTGTLSSTDLTAPLRLLNVAGHLHEGVFDFTALPASMADFIIHKNRLRGPVDLTELPPNINSFNAGYNQFQGTIDLSSLPATLYHINLNNNQLSGVLNLDNLPKALCQLEFEGNLFESVINISSSRGGLKALDVSNNKISGVVDLTGNGLEEIDINLSHNPIEAVIYKALIPQTSQGAYHNIDSSVNRYTPQTYATFISAKSDKSDA